MVYQRAKDGEVEHGLSGFWGAEFSVPKGDKMDIEWAGLAVSEKRVSCAGVGEGSPRCRFGSERMS